MTMESEQIINLDSLPLELKQKISQYLDLLEILAFKKLSRKWEDIVESIVKRDDSDRWEKLCHKDFFWESKHVMSKSQLPWFNVYLNIRLWRHVADTFETYDLVHHTDSIISAISTWKETLHIFLEEEAVHLNMNDFSKKNDRILNAICASQTILCLENECLIVYVKEKSVYFWSKSYHEDMKKNLDQISKVKYYISMEWPIEMSKGSMKCAIYNNSCYWFTCDRLWKYTWIDCSWKVDFKARYFGTDLIQDLAVIQGEVYLLTNSAIYKFNEDIGNFNKICSSLTNMYPAFLVTTEVIVNNSDTTLKPPALWRINRCSEVTVLKFQDLHKYLYHANNIICFTKYGFIGIFSVDKGTIKPNKFVTLKIPFTGEIEGLEIFEKECGHDLMLNTKTCVYRLSLTHEIYL